ncbi:MAG: hypothetical protein ABFR95_10355 [Actinomycetota bacterium]
MRQRLFLVAGWLAAAIGAGLVASGAVAVAGGQVLDRPLRPLTAAEVAALPVATVGPSDSDEPHASGGVERTPGGSTVRSADAQPDTPAEPDTDETAGTADSDQSSRWDRFINPGYAQTEVVSLTGGKASFAAADGGVLLLWATPAAGYVMHTVLVDAQSVIVSFSSNLNVWVVEAHIENGSLVVAAEPAPIA